MLVIIYYDVDGYGNPTELATLFVTLSVLILL